MAMGIISIIKKSRSVCRRESFFFVCVFRFERLITKDIELIWKFRLIANERESIKTKHYEGCQNISLQKQLLHAALL